MLGIKIYQTLFTMRDVIQDPKTGRWYTWYAETPHKKDVPIEKGMRETGWIHITQATITLFVFGFFTLLSPLAAAPLLLPLIKFVIFSWLVFGEVYPLVLQRYIYLGRKMPGKLTGKHGF